MTLIISYRTFNALSSTPQIVSSLQALSATHNIAPLLMLVIDQLMRYCITSHETNDDNESDDGENEEAHQVDDRTKRVYFTVLQQIFQDIQIQDNRTRKFIK